VAPGPAWRGAVSAARRVAHARRWGPGGPASVLLALLALLALAAAGCSPQPEATPIDATTTTARPAPTNKAHSAPRVIVVVEENHSYDSIMGSPDAPFLHSLARQGTLLTSYHAITHPSLPNYLALLGGDTLGITDDCPTCTLDASNLVDQLEAAGVSWRAYLQGLPAPCSNVPTASSYARKHNPFMYFDSVRTSPARCAKVVPSSGLDADIAAGKLPRFVYIAPDLLHDMHGTGQQGDPQLVSVADGWLHDLYDRLRASPAWQEDTRLVVTFDEGGSGDDAGCCGGTVHGGHVATIVAGPRIRAGTDSRAYSHYSLLRSTETLYGLPHLRHAADPATADIPVIAKR